MPRGSLLTRPRPAVDRCACEALELLETKGLEAHANRLLHMAASADPFSPNAFSFHFNFLYTHALDALAARRLAAFAAAMPSHGSVAPSRERQKAQAASGIRHTREREAGVFFQAPELLYE